MPIEPREQDCYASGYRYVVGIDEAGRGPLAGPVVAAAVFLRDFSFNNVLRDSKLLSSKQRELVFQEIYQKAIVGVGLMNESIIDQVNILNATLLAMRNAVDQLVARLADESIPTEIFPREIMLLVDGNQFYKDSPYDYQALVGGDRRVMSIAAASIVAKVTRDRILMVYDKVYPNYGFARHKGYPTLAHRQAIRDNGLIAIHRRSYACGA
jgi:ribonuclease HII